ncbi:MAG: HEAT repeat domain-containing protein [Leptospirales bacterium]|nr:HEAT repeat domain-containing protein [Leptospirales bacterium]
MKLLRPVLVLSCAILLSSPLFAEKSADDYISDLSAADPMTQMEACRQLGARGEKKAVPTLIQLLQSAGDARVAAHAAAALGAIGEKGPSAQALLSSSSSPQAAVRYASILALAAIGDRDQREAAVSMATQLAEGDQDELVRDIATRLKPTLEK